MKKRLKIVRERKFPSTLLFLLGYLLGCMTPWGRSSGFTFFLANIIRQADYINHIGKTLFLEICKRRGIVFLLTVLSGFTIFGVPFSIAGMILLGFFSSSVLTVSVLQFGIRGIILGCALLLPQYLLYYPAHFLLFPNIYYESHRIWKRKGVLPDQMTSYAVCVLFSFSLMAAGTLLEAYANPTFLYWIIKQLKIFPGE